MQFRIWFNKKAKSYKWCFWAPVLQLFFYKPCNPVFLSRVSRHSSENAMDTKNLAICWWPTLMRPEITSLDTMFLTTKPLEEVLQLLVEQFGFFFYGEEETTSWEEEEAASTDLLSVCVLWIRDDSSLFVCASRRDAGFCDCVFCLYLAAFQELWMLEVDTPLLLFSSFVTSDGAARRPCRASAC